MINSIIKILFLNNMYKSAVHLITIMAPVINGLPVLSLNNTYKPAVHLITIMAPVINEFPVACHVLIFVEAQALPQGTYALL